MRAILKTHHEMANKTKAITQPAEIDPSTACRYPKKQLPILGRLPISYKGPLIFLIVFSLILVPLLPGEEIDREIFNEVRTRSYRPLTLIQTADGGFALAFSTTSYGSSYTDMLLVKTDAIGVPQWNQTYGGAHLTYYMLDTLLVQTADGGFALTGDAGGPRNSSNILLVKTDANGIAQWNQIYGEANIETRKTTGKGTPGLETLSLVAGLIFLLALERIKRI